MSYDVEGPANILYNYLKAITINERTAKRMEKHIKTFVKNIAYIFEYAKLNSKKYMYPEEQTNVLSPRVMTEPVFLIVKAPEVERQLFRMYRNLLIDALERSKITKNCELIEKLLWKYFNQFLRCWEYFIEDEITINQLTIIQGIGMQAMTADVLHANLRDTLIDMVEREKDYVTKGYRKDDKNSDWENNAL